MSGQHTPGPWKVEFDRIYIGDEPVENSVAVASHRGYGPASKIEKLANARLIAAAPDLLAALKLIAERPRSKPTVPQDIVTIQRIARTALAKAGA